MAALFGVWRYSKKKEPKWLVKFPVHHVKAILINWPMTIIGVLTIARIIDHAFVLHRFLGLNWQPTLMMAPDAFYGLRWSYTTLTVETILILILSFVPLLMLLRERRIGFSKVYVLEFGLGLLLVLGIFVFYLFPGYDSLYQRINQVFFAKAVEVYNANISNLSATSLGISELIASERIMLVQGLPSGFNPLFGLFLYLGFAADAATIFGELFAKGSLKQYINKTTKGVVTFFRRAV